MMITYQICFTLALVAVSESTIQSLQNLLNPKPTRIRIIAPSVPLHPIPWYSFAEPMTLSPFSAFGKPQIKVEYKKWNPDQLEEIKQKDSSKWKHIRLEEFGDVKSLKSAKSNAKPWKTKAIDWKPKKQVKDWYHGTSGEPDLPSTHDERTVDEWLYSKDHNSFEDHLRHRVNKYKTNKPLYTSKKSPPPVLYIQPEIEGYAIEDEPEGEYESSEYRGHQDHRSHHSQYRSDEDDSAEQTDDDIEEHHPHGEYRYIRGVDSKESAGRGRQASESDKKTYSRPAHERAAPSPRRPVNYRPMEEESREQPDTTLPTRPHPSSNRSPSYKGPYSPHTYSVTPASDEVDDRPEEPFVPTIRPPKLLYPAFRPTPIPQRYSNQPSSDESLEPPAKLPKKKSTHIVKSPYPVSSEETMRRPVKSHPSHNKKARIPSRPVYRDESSESEGENISEDRSDEEVIEKTVWGSSSGHSRSKGRVVIEHDEPAEHRQRPVGPPRHAIRTRTKSSRPSARPRKEEVDESRQQTVFGVKEGGVFKQVTWWGGSPAHHEGRHQDFPSDYQIARISDSDHYSHNFGSPTPYDGGDIVVGTKKIVDQPKFSYTIHDRAPQPIFREEKKIESDYVDHKLDSLGPQYVVGSSIQVADDHSSSGHSGVPYQRQDFGGLHSSLSQFQGVEDASGESHPHGGDLAILPLILARPIQEDKQSYTHFSSPPLEYTGPSHHEESEHKHSIKPHLHIKPSPVEREEEHKPKHTAVSHQFIIMDQVDKDKNTKKSVQSFKVQHHY